MPHGGRNNPVAFMSAIGPCWVCRQPFEFNPTTVPSYQGEPICRPCITRVNEQRKAAGAPLWPIAPGAYEPEECE
jgi:hypothetical protein